VRDWKLLVAVALVTVVACVRVASTHRVFAAVIDEPAHVAAGMEWLTSGGKYVIDASHPPLARALCLLPLRISGAPMPVGRHMLGIGNEILYVGGGGYVENLALARKGNLLLLAVAIFATAAWARRVFSPGVAIVSAAFLSTLPPILGHAGLVTTDLAVAATIPLALLALDLYLESPTARRGALLGAAVALGTLSKFSFLLFFPAAAVCVIFARGKPRLAGRSLAAGALIAFVVWWGGYRFDAGRTSAAFGDSAPAMLAAILPGPDSFARLVADRVPLPAPSFFYGLGMVKAHDEAGHPAYLLGAESAKGWWYYFPVVFFYKTPLPFLILGVWGAGIAFRRERRAWAYPLAALAILGVAMTSSLNIGIRHILPMYAPLAVVAAYAAVEIWTRARGAFSRVALIGLVAWLFAGTAAAHPDSLAWFNGLAQPSPHRIAVDSNLDWGQDLLRLAEAKRLLGIDTLKVDVLTSLRYEQHGLEAAVFDPNVRQTGWLAVSETQLALKRVRGGYGWLSSYRPVMRIGESIRLYRIP
jgi:hypothetical protein